ncbi:hypothetical protein ACTFIR_006096 [Dictyostelium discoideum]
MVLIKSQLFLIFLIIVGCYSQVPPLVPNEYNCFVNLIENFNLTKFTKDTFGIYSNICQTVQTDITCSGNYVSKMVFNTGGTNNVLYPSNFSTCFTLSELTVNNLKVSPDFIYTRISSAEIVKYININGVVGGITQALPPVRSLTIHSKDLNGTTLRLEHIDSKIYNLDISLDNVYVYLNSDGANPSGTSFLGNLYANVHNIVSFSMYKLNNLKLTFSLIFDYSTINFMKTISTSQLTIYRSLGQINQYLFDNSKVSNFYLGITPDIPTEYYDMTSFVNHTYTAITLTPGNIYNFNGALPIIPPKNCDFSLLSGYLTVFPNNLNMGPYSTVSFFNSIKNTQFPAKFLGSGGSYYFTNSPNLFVGTVDSSWCTTELYVSTGNLTGLIPSCFACYFNVTTMVSYSKLTQKSMMLRFASNKFSNFNKNTPCTTFRPKVELIDDGIFNKVMVTGNDIGFDVTLWKINLTISLDPTTYVINQNGKNYTATMVGANNNLKNVEYFPVLFTVPNNVTYTFPTNYNIPPIIKSVKSTGNQIQVSGTHFSSYLEFTNQQIQIQNVGNCSTITSSDFFGAQCTMESGTQLPISNSTIPLQIISIEKDSFNVKAYIKIESNFDNNQVCPNDCSTSVGVNSICDLSSGTCKCLPGFVGSDCLGIECSVPDCSGNGHCDYTIGECICNPSHQGSDCLLPLIPCPVYGFLPCNGGSNTCNNQTGICTCDSSHQGNDCSLPLKNCPTYDLLPCNGGTNTCNNQTGVCDCDSSHQGSSCSLPLTECPIVNGLPCNGGLNTCNNQTGTCGCDSSHQGNDCSLPLKDCPTYDLLPCNGGTNTCNNQTGICDCDSSHQGSSCSLPLIECKVVNGLPCNGGLNTCNNQTGTCGCDSSHQGNDCSLPLIECPIASGLPCNGGLNTCNNQTGICNCESSFQGSNCSLPLVPCPIFSSLPCNGGLNTCNNQTGTCDCDSSHQGSDCSLPLVPCPIFSSLPCNGGLNTCNNQTGICDCDSSHQGSDCSLPLIDCPESNGLPCNGGLNACNNQTGICNCDSSHQGNDCLVPFIECPMASGVTCNGGLNTCNNQTGTCDCGPSNQGSDCSLPYIDCDPVDCNSNGVCDTTKGVCNCKENSWSGPTCLIPYHYITSTIPSTTNGGVASFIGFFGDTHNNLSITIGNLPCPLLYNSTTILNCTAPPGFGVKLVVVTQNNITYSYDKYQYLNVNNQTCPNKCSNQGTCNPLNGQCKCNNGFNGADCSGIINPGGGNNGGSNSDSDGGTGNTTISNQEVQFQIFFKSLYEIDFNGNIVETYSLQNSWKTNSTDTKNETIYTLSQRIQSNCSIISKIEEITNRNGKEYTFADETFNLQYGSIKFSIGIYNYSYKNNLNTLKLELVSSVDQLNSDDNECNEMDTSINTINNKDGESTFNYIKISKNNKILEGRFINKLVSDGRPTYLLTSMKNESKDSISILLDLPHCIESCIIDPDFSVLISPEFKNECGNSKDGRKSYVIPVAVVASVVGVSAIGAISFLIYRKKGESFDVHN